MTKQRLQYFKDLARIAEDYQTPNGLFPRGAWDKIYMRMKDIYRGSLRVTKEGLRSQYRRNVKSPLHVLTASNEDKKTRLLRLLTNRPTATDLLTRQLRVSFDTLMSLVVELQADGHRGVTVFQEDGVMCVVNYTRTADRLMRGKSNILVSALDGVREFSIGVVSDTHLGSNYEALDELNTFYDYFAKTDTGTDVKYVYHVGDISEGYYSNRPSSIFETHKVGYTEQLKYITDVYPKRDGVVTRFITGNHDVTHFRNGFANIGEAIDARRPDMEYLGHNFCRVDLTENLTMSLIHPTDGAAQSLSLKLQKIIDRNVSRRSDVMLVGHYHKSCMIKYMGIYGFLTPSFQKVTKFMEDNNLVSDVAGMILTFKVDAEGRLLSLCSEYIDLS